MYKIIIYSFLMLLVISACEEVDKLQIGETTYPVLSSEIENQAIVLSMDDSQALFPEFKWTAASFGYPSENPEYTLVMGIKDNSELVNLATTIDLSLSETNEYINRKLIALGAIPNQEANVEFMVSGDIQQQLMANSNSISATITPYEDVIEYAKLYQTGINNNWEFNDVDILYSLNDDDIYEGYIYMDNGTDWNSFKLSTQANWDSGDAIIGDVDVSGVSGNLHHGDWGGSDIYATEGVGVYYVQANLPLLTYEIYKTDWAITGDFNSWGFSQLIYNTDTYIWTYTGNFTAGGFKFIANEDWGLVKGDDEGDGILDDGTDGNNIIIEEDGNYTITLNLSEAPFSYTIVQN